MESNSYKTLVRICMELKKAINETQADVDIIDADATISEDGKIVPMNDAGVRVRLVIRAPHVTIHN